MDPLPAPWSMSKEDRDKLLSCPRCGHVLRPGDWPWCRGDAADHRNPHYGFTWGAGGPFTQRRT